MVNYDPIKVFSEGTPDPMIIYAVKNNNLLSFQWTKKTRIETVLDENQYKLECNYIPTQHEQTLVLYPDGNSDAPPMTTTHNKQSQTQNNTMTYTTRTKRRRTTTKSAIKKGNHYIVLLFYCFERASGHMTRKS